jgi:hypothetical protein
MAILTIALVVLIVLALGSVAMGALNLYAADPRARGVQLGIFLVALILIAAVYEEIGAAWAAFLFVLAVIGELLVVLRRRGAV